MNNLYHYYLHVLFTCFPRDTVKTFKILRDILPKKLLQFLIGYRQRFIPGYQNIHIDFHKNSSRDFLKYPSSESSRDFHLFSRKVLHRSLMKFIPGFLYRLVILVIHLEIFSKNTLEFSFGQIPRISQEILLMISKGFPPGTPGILQKILNGMWSGFPHFIQGFLLRFYQEFFRYFFRIIFLGYSHRFLQRFALSNFP